MAVFRPGAADLCFRTVRMRVSDWDRFRDAMRWLIEASKDVKGCGAVVVYRSDQDPSLVCIVEYWESPELLAAAYEQMGNAPWEMWERAGQPEQLEDVMWRASDLGELTFGSLATA